MLHRKNNVMVNRQMFILKIVALFFGFFLWYIIGMHHKVIISKKVPLVFYNQATACFEAPEFVTVTLRCSRKDCALVYPMLAVHVDLQRVSVGSHVLKLDREQLFVSQSIDVIHYSPATITITRSA